MKRRKFLKNSLVLSTGIATTTNAKLNFNHRNKIKGFIISDAHIGWNGKDQPTIELQAKMVKHIKNRFPDLDLVFDTGDIHHGNLNESQRNIARSQWLTHMANVFSTSLFHYIPGNHELGRGINDTELTSSKLGSHNLKPYYSFDFKGIHFISLPQLLDTILVNQESLDWLEQDLEINKDKSTLILSHNSINNTTFNNGESGYRIVINSDEVLHIINKHDNVLAWLHGHNHQYEIVNRHQRLYVSNGRIGGFNPPKQWGNFGQGHLGGVYFEIDKAGISIKCYSATQQKFFEEIEAPHLSRTLRKNTTYSHTSPTNYYYGYGALTRNVKIRIYNHYLSLKQSEIYIKPATNNILNDNYNFRYSNNLFFAGKDINRVVGYQIGPKKLKKTSVKTGLKVKLIQPDDMITVKFPTQKERKTGFLSRGSYYRCYPEDRFKVSICIDSGSYNTSNKAYISYIVKDQKHKNLFKSQSILMKKSNDCYSSDEIIVPESLLKQSRNKFYLLTTLQLTGFPSKIIIKNVKLLKQNSDLSKQKFDIKLFSEKQAIVLNKNKFKPVGCFDFQMPSINSKTSVLIKVPNVLWQVRNATAQIEGNTINLLHYRHSFQKIINVILSPAFKTTFYVNEITDIMPCKIIINEDKITCMFESFTKNSYVSVYTKNKPLAVNGAKVLSYLDLKLLLKVTDNRIVITI